MYSLINEVLSVVCCLLSDVCCLLYVHGGEDRAQAHVFAHQRGVCMCVIVCDGDGDGVMMREGVRLRVCVRV